MEDTILITILGLGLGMFVLFLILILNIKWVVIGLNIMFKRAQSKNNVGLVFIRSKGGNFNLPKVVDLNKNSEEFNITGSKCIIPIVREEFEKNGLFFNLPYKMINAEDVKTSIGLHYHQTDAEGKAMYGPEGYPVLSPIKNSVSVSGEMLKALVDEKAFSDALKDFLQKNQFILILVGANIVVAGIGLYLSYETMSTILPNMEVLVRTAISEINTKLDLIIEAVN